MSDLRAFFGPNAGYVLELHDRYVTDPASVDADTRSFFSTFDPTLLTTLTAAPTSVAAPVAAAPTVDVEKVVAASKLAAVIRGTGHLAADLDPLGGPRPASPELEIATYGLTEADLRALPASIVAGPLASGAANASEAIAALRTHYSGVIGYEFDHVPNTEQRYWLRSAVETDAFAAPLSPQAKRALLARLSAVEGFERFLHQTYLGQKRFSVEGNDVVVPMLEEIINRAAADGVKQVAIGMAHRGRLNILTHILGKKYGAIIAAFEGKKKTQAITAESDAGDEWMGDVKYHLGARILPGEGGTLVEVPVLLAPNPSHLEQVNPVVTGMARALQERRDRAGAPTRDGMACLAIQIHGDAAFPGQGVVTETLNLARLTGYSTSGTVHVIINNQIGFTTDLHDSRSTLYSSDPAKGFEIPIIHVNADEPEACLTAARLAIAFRNKFGADVLIDLIGYRRWGHNEGDEPLFTQPKMYEIINARPTVRSLWAQRLVEQGVMSAEEAEAPFKEKLEQLAGVRRSIADGTLTIDEETPAPTPRREVETAITAEQLGELNRGIHALPADFALSPKLGRQWTKRQTTLDTEDGRFDWGHAEALAYGALISEGIAVRLTGQDAERGTFSQRHLVLHHPVDGRTWMPLQHLTSATASFAVYNSPLSEAACVGFEYGYSVQAPETLVLWEGQFGDFANGAQIMIDQFLVSARAKWRQEPGLVLLLPHGYEGQGPEHSSGRVERFLQLVAQDNLRVANCTTAAQYFHLLRRQGKLLPIDRRPLVIMTPKSLLRHPLAASTAAELTNGTFMPVIDDGKASGRKDQVTRLILCSGKVIVDLEASPARDASERVAIARVEQLAPFQNTAIRAVIAAYPHLQEIVWVQEEPRNMGAWSYMEPRLRDLTGGELPVRYIGRDYHSSPAEGALDVHQVEQARIVAAAFADAPPVAGGNGRSRNGNGKTAAPKAETAVSTAAKAARRS